jgi:uncharacterized damage-inducible protein DinB
MNEGERIANQLQRAIKGEAWHGPSVMELLHDVNSQQATAHPSLSAHSIWELALHIHAWLRAGRRRLAGDRAQLSDSEDWPAVKDTDDASWKETIASIEQAYEDLRAAVLQLDEGKLDEPILPGMSSVYVTLHGVIQHCLYHAGQIAILKKEVTEGKTS